MTRPAEYSCPVGDAIDKTHSVEWWDNTGNPRGRCTYCGQEQEAEPTTMPAK